MKIRYLLLGLIAFCMISSIAGAQTGEVRGDGSNPLGPQKVYKTIFFGPVIGYNKSLHSADLATFDQDILCPSFDKGNANGFHVGFFYEHFFGGILSQHSLVVRALYNTLPAEFVKEGDDYFSKLDLGGNEYEDILTTTKHQNKVDYNMISLDLMYKFRALTIQDVGALAVTVGPTFDYIMTKKNSQKYFLVEPANVQFKKLPDEEIAAKGWTYSDDQRTITVYDGDIEEASSIRFALKAGLQMEIKLPGGFDIIPGIFYNFAFTDVSKQDWKVNAVQIGVDIRYAYSY